MGLRVAIQMDPVETINIDADSTFVLALEAQRRGHTIHHYLPRAMSFADGRLYAKARRLEVRREHGRHHEFGPMETLELASMDVILMRQDPPFDMAYITATHLLEHVSDTVLVVNDPAAVRNAPEKLFATRFPGLMPPTLITSDRDEIVAFRAEHGDIILKPLFGNGGAGCSASRRPTRSQRAARNVRPVLQGADHGAALSAGGTPGRQAHHPDRRRAGGRRQPRSRRRRGARQSPCRRPRRQDDAHAARAQGSAPRSARRSRSRVSSSSEST